MEFHMLDGKIQCVYQQRKKAMTCLIITKYPNINNYSQICLSFVSECRYCGE